MKENANSHLYSLVFFSVILEGNFFFLWKALLPIAEDLGRRS